MAQDSTGRQVVQAFAGGDSAALRGLVASDGTFHSPVADYAGSDQYGPVFDTLVGVFTGAEVVSVLDEPGQTVAFLEATIQGRPAQAVLRVITDGDGDGPASDVTLMIRPLETLLAGVKAMQQALGG